MSGFAVLGAETTFCRAASLFVSLRLLLHPPAQPLHSSPTPCRSAIELVRAGTEPASVKLKICPAAELPLQFHPHQALRLAGAPESNAKTLFLSPSLSLSPPSTKPGRARNKGDRRAHSGRDATVALFCTPAVRGTRQSKWSASITTTLPAAKRAEEGRETTVRFGLWREISKGCHPDPVVEPASSSPFDTLPHPTQNRLRNSQTRNPPSQPTPHQVIFTSLDRQQTCRIIG